MVQQTKRRWHNVRNRKLVSVITTLATAYIFLQQLTKERLNLIKRQNYTGGGCIYNGCFLAQHQ